MYNYYKYVYLFIQSTLEKKNDTSNGLDKVRLYKIIEP